MSFNADLVVVAEKASRNGRTVHVVRAEVKDSEHRTVVKSFFHVTTPRGEERIKLEVRKGDKLFLTRGKLSFPVSTWITRESPETVLGWALSNALSFPDEEDIVFASCWNDKKNAPPWAVYDSAALPILREAKVMRRWGYRNAWAIGEFEVVNRRDTLFHHAFGNTWMTDDLRRGWAAQCGGSADNHECYELLIRGERFYAGCTDGKLILGRQMRFEGGRSLWAEGLTDEDKQHSDHALENGGAHAR